ncbi:MAG: Flp pilus assembly protein CpaB [Candidatus Omnitrophica bacterium]|nr:Flp pilus assembly protein CpaB [Candidatus Omnitrophota bacterium]
MQIQAIKKYLPLIIGGICGLIAVVLINNYVKQQTEEAKKIVAQSQKNLVTVVVAKQDIPAGAAIKGTMVGEITLNRNMVQPRAAVSIDRVMGKIAIAPIAKGEQVLLNKVTVSEETGSLAMKVPAGKRAVTVSVDNISSVGGMLRPGDHVDIVGMVPIPVTNAEGKQVNQLTTMPLFQDVLVLAVGQEFMSVPSVKKEEKSAASSPVITFALSPQEANLIVFVQEQGKIRLVLRSPGDTQVQQVAPASWDTLFRTVMPQAFPQEKAVAAPAKPKKTVEIFRGLNKEVKTLE